MRMVTSKIKSLIVRELELRGGTPPAVWLATGTPMATAPTALLGFWAGWFNDRADLESSEALADFTPQRIQAAISADHLLVESIKNPRLTRSSKVWREVGGSPSTQTISPQDVHNTWTLQAQPTLQAWMDRAWIRFTLETEWAGRRLIPLPARIDQMITLVPYGADDTARLTALVETHRSSTRAYQEALAKHKTESRRIRGQDTLENLHRIRTTNGRRLRILLTCPRLHDLLGDSEGPMTNALTKTIQANGWYETPGKSPFARFAGKKSARELYMSSPRFQEMVRQVRLRPVVTDTYGCEDEIRTETHHDPIVFGVTEDAIGLAALIVLRHYCADRYGNGLPIQVLHSQTLDREELIRRFQRTGLRRSDGVPIDVLILNVRTAATGITLHRSDLFMWLDPCLIAARVEQAPARIYRVGQERPVTVLTTVNQLHGVEAQWVAQAKALTRKTQELQDRKAITAKGPTREQSRWR
nr:hypothetical protein CFP56_44398 [Quercus suber]